MTMMMMMQAINDFLFLAALSAPIFASEVVGLQGKAPSKTAQDDNDDGGYTTFYYNQTLDHFNYEPRGYDRFLQRYMLSLKYWGGADSDSPILATLGAESPLQLPTRKIQKTYAQNFRAAQVLIEHRFYGESNPVGANSMTRALNGKTIRGSFNSAQALADYAEVLLYLRRQLGSERSPIIVVGGSYGGSELRSRIY